MEMSWTWSSQTPVLNLFSLFIFCFREDPPSHAQEGSDDAEEIQVSVKSKLMSRLLRKI